MIVKETFHKSYLSSLFIALKVLHEVVPSIPLLNTPKKLEMKTSVQHWWLLVTLIICSNLKAQDLEFQTEHTKALIDLTFSDDRRFAATASFDRTIKLWDLRSKKLIRTLRGHKEEDTVIRFTNDGNYLFSGKERIIKWDVCSGKQVFTIDKLGGEVLDITVSPEGKYLLVKILTEEYFYYEIRKVSDGSVIKPFRTFQQMEYTWGPNDETIAVWNPYRIVVWSFREGAPSTKNIINPKYQIGVFTFGVNKTVITGSDEGDLDLWNYENAEKAKVKKRKPLIGHKNSLVYLQYLKDTDQFVSRSVDGHTIIWSTKGKRIQGFKDRASINLFQEFYDGAPTFLASNTDGTYTVWEKGVGPKKTVKLSRYPITKLFPFTYANDTLILAFVNNKNNAKSLRLVRGERGSRLKLNKKDNGKGLRKATYKNEKKKNKYTIKLEIEKGNAYSWASNKKGNKLDLGIGQFMQNSKPIHPCIDPTGKHIATIVESGILIRDIHTGKVVADIKSDRMFIERIIYNDDGDEILAFNLNGEMTAWNAIDGSKMSSTPLTRAGNWVTAINNEALDHQIVTGDKKGFLKFWNLKTGNLDHVVQAHHSEVTNLAHEKKTNQIASGDRSGVVKIWDAHSRFEKLLQPEIDHGLPILDLAFFHGQPSKRKPEGTFVIASDQFEIMAWDPLNTEKPVWKFKSESPFQKIDVDLPSKLIFAGMNNGGYSMWKFESNAILGQLTKFSGNVNKNLSLDLAKGFMKWSGDKLGGADDEFIGKLFSYQFGIADVVLDPRRGDKFLEKINKRRAYVAEKNSYRTEGLLVQNFEGDWRRGYGIRYIDPFNKFIPRYFKGKHEDEITSLDISPDGQYLVSGSKDRTIKLWSVDSVRLWRTLAGHVAPITEVNFSGNGNYIFSADEDNRIKIWKTNGEEKPLATIISKTPEDFLIYTPDHYYISSKGSASDIHFILDGTKVFSFEQFDLKYNRPDIVLDRLGMASESLILAYQQAYEKRLNKMGVMESQLTADFHSPEVTVKNASEIPEVSTSGYVSLDMMAKDSLFDLSRIHLFVNDVPVYGRQGKSINPTKNLEESIQVPLNYGMNKVQISISNTQGTTSLMETYRVEYKKPQGFKPNLHVIALGAYHFHDQNYNLAYVSNDVYDLTNQLQLSDHLYSQIEVDSLLNKDFTTENLALVKEKLMRTNINDVVIIYYSGHGILDEDYNYYLATGNTDFSNPTVGSLGYEAIENLLDGIPARQKLLLVDACFSGEIDEETVKKFAKENKEHGKVTLRSVGDYALTNPNLGMDNTFEIMKALFVDLRRGTGATVIASAKGGEFAIEGGNGISNGIFTHCLIQRIKSKEQEPVMISDLQEYLATEVQKLTEGMQTPSFRRKNISNDWRIW